MELGAPVEVMVLIWTRPSILTSLQLVLKPPVFLVARLSDDWTVASSLPFQLSLASTVGKVS
jgi:hypothetical protein